MRTRTDLAKYFASCGYTNGAEIGVERGAYSEVLCANNPGLHLLCVDPWKVIDGYRSHVSQDRLERFYEFVKARLSRFNATVMRRFSLDAAMFVPDESLDFVYLDAAHDYDSVRADITAWAPKVRKGGIVAGHDINRSGVIRAVGEYTVDHCCFTWAATRERAGSWFWITH